MVPLVYALLPNKTQETYERLFEALKQLEPRLQPTTVMIDFEIAAKQAIASVFPQASIVGCYFHLGQSLWRRVQSEGLQQQYQDDADFALLIRHLLALAFVPLDDMEDAFEEVVNIYPPQAGRLLDYFEDTYLGRPQRRGRRRGAVFLPQMWNQYDRVINNLPRTNNATEGWHRAFQCNVGSHHPTIWAFIAVLQREESKQRVSVQQAIAGQPPTKKRKRYEAVDKRIRNIVGDYNNREFVDYLRGIAQNIEILL